MWDLVEEAKQWQSNAHPPLTKDMLLQQTFLSEGSWDESLYEATQEQLPREELHMEAEDETCGDQEGQTDEEAASQTQTVIRMNDNHRIGNRGGSVQQKTGNPLLVIESRITSPY
jgi:hypothetical protein